MPAGLPDKAVHHAQAQPGALPLGLGGEEWLENLRLDLGRHARTGIGHRHHHVLAARHVGVAAGVGIVEHRVAGLDGQPTVAAHRVPRVDRQVQQRVFHLERVHQRIPQAARHHGLDLDAIAKRPPQHVVQPADKAAQVHHLRRQRLAPAKRQQLRCQLGAARHPGQRVAHTRLGALVAGYIARQQLQVAANHLEQVVEVVRHAAGQLADGFHLLRHAQRLVGMAQGIGGFLVAGDVTAHAVDAARGGVHRERPRHPAQPAIGPRHAAFVAHRRAIVAQRDHLLGHRHQIVRVDEGHARAAQQRAVGVAERAPPGRAEAFQHAVEAGHHQQVFAQLPEAVAVRHGLGHAAFERIVQLAQRLLRPGAHGDFLAQAAFRGAAQVRQLEIAGHAGQ
ncbi:hypothetical protein D3C87_1278760 [compost metagenome]